MKKRGKGMRKKIVVGVLGVFILLILMPSIPAIQQKTIESGLDAQESELLTKIENLDIEKIKKLLKEKGLFRPPILTFFVYIVLSFRVIRWAILDSIAVDWYGGWPIVIFPLLYAKATIILLRIFIWEGFWRELYYRMGWGDPFYWGE